MEKDGKLVEVEKRNQETIESLKKIHPIRILKTYMSGFWYAVAITWAFVLIEVVCEILIPYISQWLMDSLSNYGEIDLGRVWMFGSIMISLAVVSTTFGILAGYFASIASSGFGKNVRKAMYYKVQDFSFANIDKFSTASLVTRMTTDVTNLQNSIQMIIRTVIRAPFMMIFALIMSAVASWQLSLIFIPVLIFLTIVLFGVALIVHPTFVRVFNAYDDLNASVQENLKGIRVVKSFTREDFEKEKFGKISYFIYRTFLRAERILAFNNPAMQISSYVCLLVIAFFGAQAIIESNGARNGGLSTGELASMFMYVILILNSLMMISLAFVMIIISRNSAERISQVLIEVPSISNKENPVMKVNDGTIDFANVKFKYFEDANKYVLNDINIHIPSGSTVGIIGATGSSKSSLVSLIARLYDVSEGEVKVAGVNVKDYDLVTLRDAVSVVLQKNVLFSGTIKSNLLWGNENATEEEMKKAAKLACADEFIEKLPLKYDSPIEEGGTNVSGGQRQRLCIARALLKSPKILILDDSTSAVDTHTDALIRHSFQKEIPDVTKLIVAQRILSIKDCDLILVMDDGKIIAQGNHDSLLESSPVYKELYETQLGGGDFDAA